MFFVFTEKATGFEIYSLRVKNAVWITNMQLYLPSTICQTIPHFNRIFISIYSEIYKSSTTLGNTTLILLILIDQLGISWALNIRTKFHNHEFQIKIHKSNKLFPLRNSLAIEWCYFCNFWVTYLQLQLIVCLNVRNAANENAIKFGIDEFTHSVGGQFLPEIYCVLRRHLLCSRRSNYMTANK